MAEKKIPNPNGRKGCTEHQQKIDEIAVEMEKRNLNVFKELYVNLFGKKKKKSRYVDVAGFDEDNNLIELHQVGVANKNGSPVKRERDAMDDIEEAKGIRPQFHVYLVLLLATVFVISTCANLNDTLLFCYLLFISKL